MGLPLTGVRVLDLSHVVAGPFCSMLLADAGAEVIKIENPRGGEYGRKIGPFKENGNGERTAACFTRMNRNKKSITINLKDERGRKIFLDMIKESDIVIENFRPGVLDKMGIGYDVLKKENPKLILASISGFGQQAEDSPYWERPAYNMIAQSMGGIMSVTGDEEGPPMDVPLPIGDMIPGMMAAFAILQALIYRGQTDKGQKIDLSMYDVMSLLSERNMFNYQFTNILPKRGKEDYIAPHSAYKAIDGYFVVDCYSNKEWRKICEKMGHPEYIESLDTGVKRAKQAENLIRPMIETWASNKTKFEAAEELVLEGIAAGPVQDISDLLNCPHLKHRDMLVEVEDQIAGKLIYPGNPIKFSAIERSSFEPSPTLGEHTEILKDMLGINEAEYDELREKNIL
ncbi:CaiB/BaiF CoA transferase family protein [Alteribacillus iranensis]|uniref:CoA:oxalate CoA-transferase n=1 Tax=Alteribacillus iranensis TaxID=930128 RepID=A0A1I2B8R9_9BACI|nr:CaiB/BaiF CoA-transferase family protein [Alteribacillus iranensis]SFE52602.1 CoA:oxalate CoA-transferase [Alteribacillus iranensis]